MDDPSGWTGHVVVCGLHDEGLRVLEQLRAVGVSAVMVDEAPDPRLVTAVQRLEMPYLAADSRLPETLRAAGLEGAAALVCVESADLHALATVLTAREVRPDARVVVQLRNSAVGRALQELQRVADESRERLGPEDGIPVVTGLAAFEAPPGTGRGASSA